MPCARAVSEVATLLHSSGHFSAGNRNSDECKTRGEMMASAAVEIREHIRTGKPSGPFQVGIEAEGQEHGPVHFIARSGDPGRTWAAEYHRNKQTFAIADHALKFLRKGRHDEGYRLLQTYAAAVDGLRDIPESLRADMWRHYHAVAGYYFYSIENFVMAHESMRLAHEEVVKAITGSPFLIVLSTAFLEFRLHRARVSRNQRDWPEMLNHIETGRAMVLNRVPLCVLHNGEQIFFSSFAPFFRAQEPFTAGEAEAVRKLVDDEIRELLFDRFIRGILKIPGFATDWS
jgi:hypothetical protein